MYTSYVDLDECCIGGYCHENATCTNTPGGYICTCKEGYSGNSTFCEGKNGDNSENHRALRATHGCQKWQQIKRF